MGIINLFKLISKFALILFLFSCERAVEDTNYLSIKIPDNFAQISQNTFTATSNYAANLVSTKIANNLSSTYNKSTEEWYNITPTGYSGLYNINCFFAVVDADDVPTKAGSCFRKDQSSIPVTQFVAIGGPAFLGSEIQIRDVPAGKSRSIYLYGMHANSAADCVTFDNSNFKRTGLSKPYSAGQVLNVEVVKGQSSPVTINGESFNSNKYLDYCVSSLPSPGIPNTPIPDHFEVSVDTGLFGGTIHAGQCLPVTMALKDKSGTVTIPNPDIRNFGIYNYISLINRKLYNNAYECLNNNTSTNYVESVNFTGLNEARKWIYIDSTANALIDFSTSFKLSLTYLQRSWDNFLAQAVTNIRSTANGASVVASVPEIARNGACQQVAISGGLLDWSSTPQIISASTIQIYSIQNTTGATSTNFIKYFPTADDCLNESNPITPSPGLNDAFFIVAANTFYKSFYVKYSSLYEGDMVNFRVVITSGSSYEANYRVKILAPPNSATPLPVTKLKLRGPTELLKNTEGKCIGPFRLSVTDSGGAENYIQSQNRKIALNYNNTQLKLFNSSVAAPCSGADEIIPSTATQNINISSNSSSAYFYVKPLANDSSIRYVYAYDLDNNLTYDKMQININDIAAPPTTAPVVDPCNFCFPTGDFIIP